MDRILVVADASDWFPPLSSWMTTALYCWLALLCGKAWWEDREARRPRRRLGSPLWLGLIALFVGLAFARAFGAQGSLTGALRRMAEEEGWYDLRRRYQLRLVLALIPAALVATILIGWVARKRGWRDVSVLAPVALLLGFLALRVISFHYVDAVLYRSIGRLEVNHMAEWTILGLTAVAIYDRMARKRRVHSRGSIVAQDDDRGARRYSVPGAGS